MNKVDANKVRQEFCRVGKIISVDLEITEFDGAEKIAETLFNGESFSGVKVHSWGLFNTSNAMANRDIEINEELQRHRERMGYLMNPNNLRDFAKGKL